MQNISILDYLILPFVLIIIYAFAYRYRNAHYKGRHPYRKYFIPALTLKIGGAIFIGIIYEYYYKGGDTFNYFYHAQVINSSFSDSIIKWVNLLFRAPDETTIGYYQYISRMFWYQDPPSYLVAAITAFISKILFETYLPTAVVFAALSFTGIWALFRTFSSIYSKYVKQVAIATLFIPSVIVWGSGVFKDTICIFALGWLTYGTFKMLINRQFNTSTIVLTVLSFYLVALVKLYILMAFLPALAMWLLFSYTQKIRNVAGRVFLKATVLLVLFVGSVYVMTFLGTETLGRYSLENIQETSEITRNYIESVSGEEGSGYNLGEIGSVTDMLLISPAAINVTFFRPYLWESRKIIVMSSAVEAALLLFIAVKLLFVVGFGKVWRTISEDPTIQFCLVFAFIFGFAVGLTSGNFGTLSRYRIPCLPFFTLALLIIYYKNTSRPLLKFLRI